MLPLRALFVACLACSACGRPPTPAECNALLDRYMEKLLGSDRPGLSAGEILKLQGEARARAATDPTFAECSERVSRRAYDCAMKAETVDRMEICLN
ncbi:MAG TPA: hypothetical protein VGK73_13945 [Polyangiaceae bacterium]